MKGERRITRHTILSLALLSVLLLAGYPLTALAVTMKNKDHMIVATISEPETVDPAWAYDTASAELIFNVYDSLIRFNYEKVDEFVPCLATEWTIEDINETSPEGLTWVQRYTFKMRNGVKFHDGSLLTTEDVEYSFERWMVQDRLGGYAWLIYEPLMGLGTYNADLLDPIWDRKIDNAVQHNTTHVWFNLVMSYAPFLQILSQSWSSIVNKEFCVAHGDWPGTWENWQDYHDPDVSPLDTGGDWMCGTGPYKLDYWIRADGWWGEYSLVKFDDYWQGWPAPNCDGYVSRVNVKIIPPWPVKKEMFLNGTADIIYVPREYVEELEGVPGIRCIKDLLTLICNALFFNFNISSTSPYMGAGGLPPGTFSETGIPSDFFSDIHVRKGFAHCFNYTRSIEDPYRYNGEGIQPASPVVEGLPYHNPLQEKYSLDLTKAEEEFKLAWDGQVWDKGFELSIIHLVSSWPPIGNWSYVLKANVESLNPKFHISVGQVHFSEYLQLLEARELTMFLMGWAAEYPDPHSFIHPFMHSNGIYAYWQSYSNATVDALIEEGVSTINTTRRREIYYELQAIYHDQCPSVPTVQPLTRHWERDWVQGWYYNPAYPGEYFYHLWKGILGDTDADGDVDLVDLGNVLIAYDMTIEDAMATYGVPAGTDIDGDGWVDYDDVVWVVWNYGY